MHADPLAALITLIGLAIMAGAILWFLALLLIQPKELGKKLKTSWKIFWDGFWGLG
ncbi:hypothetical protein [Thermomonas sp. XSG]|uniref:hypothetical protein n=1 Tax=Thermomonas sp. XSG TaxID=2771436 RepID=UPI001680DD58|nr:hypothetical protein [Thermomonas sp. XSG]QNU15704.1 hypothetical protein ICG51_002090 [Thermomonas sp. XSG]